MGIDDFSHTGLFLGLGISSPPLIGGHVSKNPSLTLSLSNERRSGGQDSAASCLSNGSVKRERSEVGGDDDVDDGSNGRKKLRLNKAQSAMLEESFKRQNTLNHKEKQELSKELNLSPRQVEVWFQNRRARSKLKQTELDCELMKKWYETLIAENRRLQEEVRQLKAVKLAKLPPPPLYMPLPATAAALAICPSCETETATKRGFAVAPAPHLYSC